MKVAEKFVSVNGEGTRSGETAVFIRFKGCNLSCGYCDSEWANKTDCAYEELSPLDITDYILSTGINNVTLTGGEPLLQKDLPILLELLKRCSRRVEVETNGSVELTPFCKDFRPVFTMDFKLGSSGCEKNMLTSNFDLLKNNDTVKFVIGDADDLKQAGEVIKKYGLCEKCHVYLSPVFNKMDPADIANYMKEQKMNGVRLQLQIHKFIWAPDKRGV